MFFDYHTHTIYSDDSDYPLESVIRDAIGMGMQEICITDHVDFGVKIEWDEANLPSNHGKNQNVNYPAYFEEIEKMKSRYGKQIAIRQGMEFGIQTHTIADFQRLFAAYPFDFIIFSCHQVEDKEFWTQDFQTGRSQREYNERYYSEILNVIRQYKDYSVLGHLDLIKRYDNAGEYPFANVADIIAEILKTAIYDGKGIELNTSTIRYGLTEWMPSWNILKLYKELGGEIITIGSDSHAPAHLGAYIPQAMQELKEEGFKYICTFQQMQPIFHKL